MTLWSIANVLVALLLVLTTSILLAYAWIKRKYSYWQRKGIDGPTPSIPLGNFTEVFKKKVNMGELLQRMYFKYKHKKMFGAYMFFEPMFGVTDYELTHRILGPDFPHFTSHGPEIDEELDPLGVHLFNASGKQWKELRAKLTPVFTTGKLKNMFKVMDKIGDELQSVVMVAADEKKELEMRDMVARFTTDVIGNCAFGVECNSLRDEDAPFRRCGQRIFSHDGIDCCAQINVEQVLKARRVEAGVTDGHAVQSRLKCKLRYFPKYRDLKIALGFFFPSMCKLLGIKPQKKDVQEFIYKSVNDTVEYREKNKVKRNDFLDLLLQIKKGTITDDQGNQISFGEGGLTENEFMSQVYLFFVAGFETSSSTTSFALYELACNPDVQERARQHVRAVLEKHGGQYSYDAFNDMEYLSNVVNETLRKYPPLAMMFRKCTADYKIPGTDVLLEKDTQVFMPILGMQMDPEYFPEPEKFDPDRYTPENKHPQLNKLHLPFGQGPRLCIGQRFGMLQSKMALAKLLDKYSFTVGKQTDVPMKQKPGFNITSPLNGIWLKVHHAK